MTKTEGNDAIVFIKKCFAERKILWTYHVNMRLVARHISRYEILDAADSMEIIEKYPGDKYLPSYLLYAGVKKRIFHVHVAVDAAGDNVRIITAYEPDPKEWSKDFKKRRKI